MNGVRCGLRECVWGLLFPFTFALWSSHAAASLVRISSSIQSNGWVRIIGGGDSEAVMTLDASPDLVRWTTIAVLHGYGFEFADPVSPKLSHRFYRVSASLLTATNDWKNQVATSTYPYDKFSVSLGSDYYVKFAITTNEPARVYYADGKRFPLHYDFATARLGPFLGFSHEQFDQAALYNAGRQIFLGAVIFPGPRAKALFEYGIQFVSRDPLPRDLVRDLFELVKSTVIAPPEYRVLYIPAFEQFRPAEIDRAWFETNGIPIASTDRWAEDNTCYVFGWALGTLKFFTGAEIGAAYADGRLLPQDILLTDAVPSELPYVAGIITLAPSTPNSHVAILARSYGVPFVHLLNPAERERVLGLVGHDIALQVFRTDLGPGFSKCSINVFDLGPDLDPALKAEILALKSPPPVNITPVARYGAYTAATDNLVPADIRFFGGKAANYGLLRRTIPSNAPIAIAISFDLWDEFMEQTLPNGKTLRAEIADRLAGYRYPIDIGAIKTALNSIRSLIRQSTGFTTNQQQAIVAALRIFDSRKKIRFRSSTNVEDAEAFTGAGLYDSYSGCLEDDLDSDDSGPSACDPNDPDERGVFRAIRRVYASFYNDNACLERLRRGVNETNVGMAMLVHHSTPDEIEMANGVATANTESNIDLVTQTGANSVANPDGSAAPEVVKYFSPSVRLIQGSSLLPLGDHVMEWESDYRTLGGLLSTVTAAYRQMTGKQGQMLLDFEYKKIQPGWLEVKQVREVPLPETNRVARYLLSNPVILVPPQGLEMDLFATHRLKSRWIFNTRNFQLTPTNLSSTIYTELTVEHLNGDRIETISGPIQSFSGFSNGVHHAEYGSSTFDSWQMPSAEGLATFELQTWFLPEQFAPSHEQVFVSAAPWVKATYDHLVYGRNGFSMTRYSDSVPLRMPRNPNPMPHDVRYDATFTFSDENTTVTIRIIYTMGAYTLFGDDRWLVGTPETRIEGLTSEPIVLTNYFSQTMSMGHLSSAQSFLLEPRFEPGISPTIVSELEAMNIRIFSLATTSLHTSTPGLSIMGRDNTFRAFGSIAGRTLTISVAASDAPPFVPAGSLYSIFFNDDFNCTVTDDQGNERATNYSYARERNVATLVLDIWSYYRITSTLTFDTVKSGTIHSDTIDQDCNVATEEGTFSFD
jgi:hypothetical protein